MTRNALLPRPAGFAKLAARYKWVLKMAATQIQRVSHRHDAIIDFLLGNPEVKDLHVLCEMLNVSRSWLSIVMRSDAFRTEYERRRGEYNQDLAQKVQRKLYDVTLLGLSKVADALEESDELDPRFALDVVDKATNRLGLGPTKGTTPVVEFTQNVQVVDKDLLQSARDSMKVINGTTIDSEKG